MRLQRHVVSWSIHAAAATLLLLLNYEIISYSKNSRGKLLMMGYTLSHWNRAAPQHSRISWAKFFLDSCIVRIAVVFHTGNTKSLQWKTFFWPWTHTTAASNVNTILLVASLLSALRQAAEVSSLYYKYSSCSLVRAKTYRNIFHQWLSHTCTSTVSLTKHGIVKSQAHLHWQYIKMEHCHYHHYPRAHMVAIGS